MAKSKKAAAKKAKGPTAMQRLDALERRVGTVLSGLEKYIAAGPTEAADVEAAKGELLAALRG